MRSAPPSVLNRVLIIAGSDSGGGAGIQADIKTVTCLGGYAATAVTALTAQNTQGVFGIYPVPDAFIAQQIRLVLEDIGADAIKTGMLATKEVIETVAASIAHHNAPLILDPVMVAKGGAPLLEHSAIDTLKQALLPRAALITPNTPEAELLTGIPIHHVEDMRRAAGILLKLGAKAAFIKGGHMPGESITNLLLTETQEHCFTIPRIDTRHTHGTGCTLASAIATGLAQSMNLKESIERGQAYVSAAIAAAPGIGKGHGPLAHGFACKF